MKAPSNKRARSRAAKQGALVRKVRAGKRGALAELLRKFPARGREIRAERRYELAKAKAKPKPKQKQKQKPKHEKTPKRTNKPPRPTPTPPTPPVAPPRKRKPAVAPSKKLPKPRRPPPVSIPPLPTRPPSSPPTKKLAKALQRAEAAEARARAAEENAKRLEEAAKRLEAEFQAALEKDRLERQERLRRIAEARRKAEEAGFPAREHHRWEGPPQVDLTDLVARLSARTYADLPVHGVRVKRLRRGGFIIQGHARDPRTGERFRLRGYEIVRRVMRPDGSETSKRYVFWGDRKKLSAFSPAQTFEEVVSPPEEAGMQRPPEEDMIMAWNDA